MSFLDNLLSLLLIISGGLLVFIFAGDFILRAFFTLIGLKLIARVLGIKNNDHRFVIFMKSFPSNWRNRF
jgi:hypothetical protein